MKCLQVEDITIPGINILVPFNSSLSPPPSRHVFQEERYGRPHCLTLNLDSSLETAGSHSTDASTDASISRSTPPLLNSLAIQTSSRTELEEWAGALHHAINAVANSDYTYTRDDAVSSTLPSLLPDGFVVHPSTPPNQRRCSCRVCTTVPPPSTTGALCAVERRAKLWDPSADLDPSLRRPLTSTPTRLLPLGSPTSSPTSPTSTFAPVRMSSATSPNKSLSPVALLTKASGAARQPAEYPDTFK